MAGFSEALDAAAKDPFGKFVPVKQPKQAVATPPAVTTVDKVETASVAKPSSGESFQKTEAARAAEKRRARRAAIPQTQNIQPRDGLY